MPNAEHELDLPLIPLPKIANFSTEKLLEFCYATMFLLSGSKQKVLTI